MVKNFSANITSLLSTVSEFLFKPLFDVFQQTKHRRKCSVIDDSLWLKAGVYRCIKLFQSGRDFLQERRRNLENPHEFDLTRLVKNLVNKAIPQAEAKGILLKKETMGSIYIHGEEFLLETAVGNLLQNAIDFTPTNGTIKVRLSSNDKWVTVSISDTGCGIPDFAEPRIFERFYSLPRADGGKSSGLGLCLAQEAAELHGGTIRIKNRPVSEGPGTIATLKLKTNK
ncbi:MAG: ATP-binding protein [Chthoniobacterales bacterium]